MSVLFSAWKFFQHHYLADSSIYPVLPGITSLCSSLLRYVYLLANAEGRRLCHLHSTSERPNKVYYDSNPLQLQEHSDGTKNTGGRKNACIILNYKVREFLPNLQTKLERSVGSVTRLRSWLPRNMGLVPDKYNAYLFSRKVLTNHQVHPVSCLILRCSSLFRVKGKRSLKLTHHLRLVPRYRTSNSWVVPG